MTLYEKSHQNHFESNVFTLKTFYRLKNVPAINFQFRASSGKKNPVGDQSKCPSDKNIACMI